MWMVSKAAYNGNLEMVKILLQYGADVNAENSIGWSPLHMAAHQGKLEIVKFLVQNGSYVKDKLNRTPLSPLDYASLKGHEDIVKYLENQKKVEEEAIRKKTEENARLKAEEIARKKAEEIARKKAEEKARKKAEENAKKKAEERARKKAEEEAKRKADEEERIKAEKNAKRKCSKGIMSRDYYSILGIQKFPTWKLNEDGEELKLELKNAFHKLAVKYHPDKNNSPDAEEKFKKIKKA